MTDAKATTPPAPEAPASAAPAKTSGQGLASIVTTLLGYIKSLFSWILGLFGKAVPAAKTVASVSSKATGLTFLGNTLMTVGKNWQVLVLFLPLLILAYAWGHHEEAKKYTAVFSKLASCVSSAAKPVTVPVCVSAPTSPAALMAPTPAVALPAPAAPAAASPAPAKPTVHRKKRLPSSIFGSL